MDYFEELIKELSSLEEVEGLMLGGSRATGQYDQNSDYDVYVYLNQALDEEKRIQIMSKYCSYMEYSNRFWELEDDGILKSGIDIEFIYRHIDDLDQLMKTVIVDHQANFGYTTCFWDNLKSSKLLYDKGHRLKDIQKKVDVDYPIDLKNNIIQKNFLLIKDKMPSFYYQIEKAVKREDFISINHRITELLASYFDIIFAVNEIGHPGEKRLLAVTKKLPKLPNDYVKLLGEIFEYMYQNPEVFLETLDQIIHNLKEFLVKEGYDLTFESYLKR